MATSHSQIPPEQDHDAAASSRPATRAELARYRRYLLAEWEAAALYRRLAEAEPNAERARLLRELAAMEDHHAARWQAKLEAAGVPLPRWEPGARTRLLGWLARRFGTRSLLPLLERLEDEDANMYAREPAAADFSEQERTHTRIFARLRGTTALDRPRIAEREGRHRGAGGGSLRASIFGINDGLVSNLSLVMGVAGADPGAGVVLLAGLAGLLAGACSMAQGEYLSMRAQRELFERELAVERAELEEYPEEEQQELALLYQAKGLPREEAERVAQRLIANKATALDTLAREELGLDPGALGSPVGAAASSFLSFSLGAFVPVAPYLFTGGPTAALLSAALSALALAAAGALTALLTGRSLLFGGARMLLLGSAAAALTHLVGRLLGVTVAG